MITKLAEHMAIHGLSQRQVAERVGASQPLVSTWIHAKRRPDLTNALAIEREFGIPAGYWLTVKVENASRRPPRAIKRISRRTPKQATR